MQRCSAQCLRAKWRAALHGDTAASNLAELQRAVELAKALPVQAAGGTQAAARCAHDCQHKDRLC